MLRRLVSLQVKVRDNSEECEAGEAGEGEVELKKMADVKYNEFQRVCGHLLDQSLTEEFSLMQSLGLPTKFINSYEDMESGVSGWGRVCVCCDGCL